jgi:hypothetical protein
MVASHRQSGASYRTQLVSVIERAAALEQRAHESALALADSDPERRSWQRVEQRYARIRGDAARLLAIHDQSRRQPRLERLRRYLHLR